MCQWEDVCGCKVASVEINKRLIIAVLKLLFDVEFGCECK